MKRDLITWTVYLLRAFFRFRFIARIQIQSCRGRFIITFLHLSTLPRSNFPGSHGAKKYYRLVFFLACALQNSYFFMFSFMACANLATSPKRLETKLANITRCHFCSFFVLNIPLFTFSFPNSFPLFVCFDILWQLATTHARDNTRDRDANSSSQNGVTWWDFLQGNKSSSRSLARFCCRKQKKSTARPSTMDEAAPTNGFTRLRQEEF